jgi:hypothetical protein
MRVPSCEMTPVRSLRSFVLWALVGLGCGAPVHGTTTPRLDHASSIVDLATWERMAEGLEGRSVAHVDEVKFLIDTTDLDAAGAPHVYFVDSHRYDSHYDFARSHLDRDGGHISPDGMRFYVSEYRRPDRRFLLGSLIRYRDADAWAFEILSGDNMSAEQLQAAFGLVRERVFFGEAMRFHPISDLHARTLTGVPDGTIPTIGDDVLHAGWSYEPIEEGIAYGYLRIIHGRLDPTSVRPNQILVTEEVPDDIPVVGALVTSRFQAPLAHVALLSANRHTPDAALRDAITDPRVVALEGRLVRLDVTESDLVLGEATLADATAHWASIRPQHPFSPPLDLAHVELTALDALSASDVPFAGAKASNLGEAARLPGVEVPSGFVVPMHFFAQHLEANGIRADVDAMLADPAFQADAGVRAERLAALRARIVAAPVDAALVRSVRSQIAALHAPGRLRFRSSTNAEDLPGFNGAGLYSSITAPHDPTDADVASALTGVWASVYNLGAHEEREWYRIDHAQVAMAVLVQTSVDDGIAIGVALTANPFDRQRPAVFIDAQTMDGSVTGAGSDEVPEQFLVLTYLPEREPEVLSRSSRTGGAPILSDTEVLRLTDVLVALHAHFAPHFPAGSNAVDVEFLVAGPDHRPIIVQARPFAVSYDD